MELRELGSSSNLRRCWSPRTGLLEEALDHEEAVALVAGSPVHHGALRARTEDAIEDGAHGVLVGRLAQRDGDPREHRLGLVAEPARELVADRGQPGAHQLDDLA